jgi:DNA-directed RNA polymerase specialized sigma24 family protein
VHEGESRTLAEIARMVGMKTATLHMRLRRGMTLAEAIAKPVRERVLRWSLTRKRRQVR